MLLCGMPADALVALAVAVGAFGLLIGLLAGVAAGRRLDA